MPNGTHVFASFFKALNPGGSVWVFDLVESSIPAVQELMRERYGEYLTELKDEAYRRSRLRLCRKGRHSTLADVSTGPDARGRDSATSRYCTRMSASRHSVR